MLEKHFECLFVELSDALSAVARGEQEAAIRSSARFHWRYVHLHPFRCANQCVAMNMVNWLLGRALGAGIPHLLLDPFAVRLQLEAYVQLFARSVANLIEEAEPATRYRRLRDKKRLSFSGMQRVAEAGSRQAARAVMKNYPEEAEAALLGSMA